MTYLRQGYELVKDIREIIQLTDNNEADGMAAVYEADYQMLLGLGIAQRTYREAMDLFVEAGIDDEKVIDFFTRPAVLPVSEYYTSIDEAINAQKATGYEVLNGEEGSDPKVYLGNYTAWNESVPYTAMPALPEILSDIELELTKVEMEFRISSRGKTRGPDAESSEPDLSLIHI